MLARAAIIGIIILCSSFSGQGQISGIDADETVRFFPTYAVSVDGGKAWEARIHGWIFEPENRHAEIDRLCSLLNVERHWTAEETKRFTERTAAFLVDNERNQRIVIELEGRRHTLARSTPDGHFSDRVRVSADEIRPSPKRGNAWGQDTSIGSEPTGGAVATGRAASRSSQPGASAVPQESQSGAAVPHLPDGWIEYSAVLRESDRRRFAGRVLLACPEGLSVLSDIDDTLKKTGVGDKVAVLRSTFLEEFAPIEGMAVLLRSLAEDEKATIHYVSASPWQLAGPLSDFLEQHRFPPGTLHLQPFRLSTGRIEAVTEDGEDFKIATLARILDDFPKRRFVLIGDASQRDPEAYGEIARRHAEQVVAVWIRVPELTPAVRERLATAMRGVPANRWRSFDKPAERGREWLRGD